jgi:hypothetical protein
MSNDTLRRVAALLAALALITCAFPISVASAIPPGDFDEEGRCT